MEHPDGEGEGVVLEAGPRSGDRVSEAPSGGLDRHRQPHCPSSLEQERTGDADDALASALSLAALAQSMACDSVSVEESRNVQIGNNIHIHGEVTLILPAESAGLPALQSSPEQAKPEPASSKKTSMDIRRFWRQQPCFTLLAGLATLAAVVVTVVLASVHGPEVPESAADEVFPGLVTRREWKAIATPTRGGDELLQLPVQTVVVHHTLTMPCTDQAECIKQVSWLQMKSVEQDDDIPYNLLVGGDGLVYEGRGWSTIGASVRGWNAKVLSVALIGNFDAVSPTKQQRAALVALLQWGVDHAKIQKAYRLAGACQLREYEYFNDTSPGAHFMADLQTWDHWWDFVVNETHSCAFNIPCSSRDRAEVDFLVSRECWLARSVTDYIDPLPLPVKTVIVHHTRGFTCQTRMRCTQEVRQLQDAAMTFLNMSDIDYNFLVGGDGRVYLGRGWEEVGAHTLSWNNKSIGVAAIGTFTYVTAPPALQDALLRLLQWGVQLGKLTADYDVIGKCQVRDSDSPGKHFMQDLRSWKHWSNYTAVSEACTT